MKKRKKALKTWMVKKQLKFSISCVWNLFNKNTYYIIISKLIIDN